MYQFSMLILHVTLRKIFSTFSYKLQYESVTVCELLQYILQIIIEECKNKSGLTSGSREYDLMSDEVR